MEKVQEIALAVQGNKYLKSISNGLMALLPILMIGSLALLVAVLPIPGWKDILSNTGVRPYLMATSTLTTSCMTLYAVFMIAYRLADEFHEEAFRQD